MLLATTTVRLMVAVATLPAGTASLVDMGVLRMAVPVEPVDMVVLRIAIPVEPVATTLEVQEAAEADSHLVDRTAPLALVVLMDLVVPMVQVVEVPVALEVQAATAVVLHMADHRALLALVGLVAQVALVVVVAVVSHLILHQQWSPTLFLRFGSSQITGNTVRSPTSHSFATGRHTRRPL